MATSSTTDLQLILLTVASRRKAATIHPLPSAAGKDEKVINAAIESLRSDKLVSEAEAADARQLWREEDGERVALVLTDKGRALAERESAKGQKDVERISKISAVIGLLRLEDGATLDDLTAATGWQPHTARAALTGLKKKGYMIERTKDEGVSRYRIREGAAQ